MTTAKELYEKIIASLEDIIDINTVEAADFNEGRDFEEVAKELNV